MMRGLLQIRSAIAPFRRAGLVFASTREPVELRIDDLSGAHLLALLAEPAITVTISDENGEFGPLPALDADMTADHVQMAIDAIAESMPPREEPVSDVVEAGGELEARIASLIEQGEADHQARVDLMVERDELNKLLIEMTKRAENAEGQIGDLLNKIIELKDQLAALTPAAEQVDTETAPVDPPAAATDKAQKKPKASAPAPA